MSDHNTNHRTYQLVIQLRKYKHHTQEQVSENEKSCTLLALSPGSRERKYCKQQKAGWGLGRGSTLHGFDFTNIGTGTKHVRHCGKCSGCVAMDCGSCINCKDIKKFGGPGRKKEMLHPTKVCEAR